MARKYVCQGCKMKPRGLAVDKNGQIDCRLAAGKVPAPAVGQSCQYLHKALQEREMKAPLLQELAKLSRQLPKAKPYTSASPEQLAAIEKELGLK